jgi:hypothetical protein
MDLRNKMVGFAYGGFDDAAATAAAANLIKMVNFQCIPPFFTGT